jgi:cytochrome c
MTMGMMKPPAATVAHALWLAALLTHGWAGATPQLAQEMRCMNCHALDRKLVGPSFRDVARRYAQQPQAQARLAEKIVKGGAGAWGPVPMAANPHVKPEDAQRLAAWVLGLL